MRRGRTLVVAVAAVIAVAVGAPLAVRHRAKPPSAAARMLRPLPAGFRYGTLPSKEVAATAQAFRQDYGATDVAVALVGTPQDRSPLGVKVVVLVLPAAPEPRELAASLARDVPLADAQPRTVAGRAVLAHDGDDTFSSSALWVDGRTAVVAYGATTVEVEAVLGELIDLAR